MINGGLRTIGIPYLETEALLSQLVASRFERIGGLPGHQCNRLFIAVNTGSHEVIGAVIADFQYGIRDYVGDIDELGFVLGGKHCHWTNFLSSLACHEGIYLVGVDALPEAIDLIKEGNMTGTVLNDHIGQSHAAVDVAVKLLNGEEINNYYWVDYVMVNKAYVDAQ